MSNIQDIANEGVELCDSLLQKLEDYEWEDVPEWVEDIKETLEDSDSLDSESIARIIRVHHHFDRTLSMRGVAMAETYPLGEALFEIRELLE